jgi:hypothetical protein
MPRWTREPDADQRIKLVMALTQIYCAGDLTANINLIKNAKERRKRSKIKGEEVAILYKEQVKAWKEAWAAALEAKRKVE